MALKSSSLLSTFIYIVERDGCVVMSAEYRWLIIHNDTTFVR